MTNKTKQATFWEGDFGNDYVLRNMYTTESHASRCKFWANILSNIHTKVESVMEVGCNVGQNLKAISVLSNASLFGCDVNSKALDHCIMSGILSQSNAIQCPAENLDIIASASKDIVFTSGVLIHINPSSLNLVTDHIVRIASKYVICIEYFADKEESVNYRGNDDVLFKRDFGSYYLDKYPELELVNYGFSWRRDTGLDNLTWWIFKVNKN